MRSTVTQAAVVAVLLVGAVLRTVQYGATTSLSLDEAAVVFNVIQRGWNDLLFQPLMDAQVASFGFLFLEKASFSIAGNTDAAFRFFPYLLSLVSLVLFWRVSKRYLPPPAMLAALIVFAVSPTLVLYTGVAKQYSGDIAITLLLLCMTLRFLDGPVTLAQAAVVGVAGGVALLLSQPAVLVASGLSVLLLVHGRRAGKPTRQLLVVCTGWFVGAAVVTCISLSTLSASTSEYMQHWWRDGFVPRPWLGLEELFWIPSRLGTLLTFFASGLHPPLRSLPEIAVVGLYTFLLPLGFLHMIKKDVRTAVLLAVPVIVAIAAAVVRLLPLAGRVSLFLGPVLLICCFAGFDRIRAWMPQRLGGVLYAAALGLAILPAFAGLARNTPPIVQGGTRPVLQEVQAHWIPGDRLVVSRGRWTFNLVEYYGHRLGLEGWTHLDRLQGDYTAEEILRTYLRRIDAFRGVPRVWFHLEGTAACEDEAILGYLSAIGKRLHSVEFHLEWGHRISAHLYDLSDPELLAKTSAERYLVPECELGASSPSSLERARS